MGTPDFSTPILQTLNAHPAFDVIHVYCQPPRAAGRGKKPRPTPVHQTAEALGIPVSHPERLKEPEEQETFAALGADVAVVAAYGLILPKAVLDAPRLGCVNVHASLLPRWRGAAPIQRAIMAGDRETGVTIMQMDVGLDTGDMLLEERLPITGETTAETLHDALSALGAKLIVPALLGLTDGSLVPRPQPEEGVTYAAKINKAEARLDWTRPAPELDCHARGLAPFPGAWFEHGGERIKVLMCAAETGSGEPGVLLDDALLVACGAGALRLRTVQRPGKGPLDAEAFLRGYALPTGTRLS
ncbi:MAG: methionyl-tRNA formyltransferase [Rhodospirillum sp.]|nr:methionyl-tRNA formyltransferase [Rhodospirillum sp.]MCF8491513.1 methionyl-tRNA formyltransferase [Rhodospirillum sp.]